MKFPALSLLALLVACGGKHPGSYETTESTTSQAGQAATLIDKADQAWAKRLDEDKLVLALEGYEGALKADPSNRHALERLTRGWYFYGDGYTDVEDEKLARWGKAIEYGTRCLALNEEFAAAIEAGDKEKDAATHATMADVPCLYWTSSALGKWAKAQGLSTTLKHLPAVKAYMTQVETHDPTYFYYGPARYWGAYYAALPSFAGQDFDKSAEYFKTAIKGAPEYLGTRVLRADFLAVPSGNIALFDRDLQYVTDASLGKHPEIIPENTKEKEKATALLATRHELFPRKAIEAADAANGDQ